MRISDLWIWIRIQGILGWIRILILESTIPNPAPNQDESKSTSIFVMYYLSHTSALIVQSHNDRGVLHTDSIGYINMVNHFWLPSSPNGHTASPWVTSSSVYTQIAGPSHHHLITDFVTDRQAIYKLMRSHSRNLQRRMFSTPGCLHWILDSVSRTLSWISVHPDARNYHSLQTPSPSCKVPLILHQVWSWPNINTPFYRSDMNSDTMQRAIKNLWTAHLEQH